MSEAVIQKCSHMLGWVRRGFLRCNPTNSIFLLNSGLECRLETPTFGWVCWVIPNGHVMNRLAVLSVVHLDRQRLADAHDRSACGVGKKSFAGVTETENTNRISPHIN